MTVRDENGVEVVSQLPRIGFLWREVQFIRDGFLPGSTENGIKVSYRGMMFFAPKKDTRRMNGKYYVRRWVTMDAWKREKFAKTSLARPMGSK